MTVMKKENIFSAAVGTMFGAGIWIAVAAITGRREAWDGNLLYYAGSLLAAGCVIGLAFPTAWLSGVLGIYLGQIIVILLKSGRDFGLLPFGLIALLIFTSVSAAGGFICALARTKNKKE